MVSQAFQISNFSGGACPRTPLDFCAFGAGWKLPRKNPAFVPDVNDYIAASLDALISTSINSGWVFTDRQYETSESIIIQQYIIIRCPKSLSIEQSIFWQLTCVNTAKNNVYIFTQHTLLILKRPDTSVAYIRPNTAMINLINTKAALRSSTS